MSTASAGAELRGRLPCPVIIVVTSQLLLFPGTALAKLGRERREGRKGTHPISDGALDGSRRGVATAVMQMRCRRETALRVTHECVTRNL